MSKKQLRAVILTAMMTTAGLSISSSALADTEANTTPVPSPVAASTEAAATPEKYHQYWRDKKPCGPPMMGRMLPPPGFVPGAMNLGLLQNKHLTIDEAKIIVQAGLLLDNRRDLKIGNIRSQTIHERKFYIIPILDKQGAEVSTAVMNSDTGMVRPLPKGGLPAEKLNQAPEPLLDPDI